MADELEILTENAAGNSWADLVPGDISTGYQAQNTNIDANRNGIDASSVSWDGGASEIVFSVSGIMDVNGIPFVAKSEARASLGIAGVYYIKLIAGSTSLLKSISLVTTPGTYDASKNGFYESGDRVLDWVIYWEGAGTPTITKRLYEGISTPVIIATDALVENDLTVENDALVENDLTVVNEFLPKENAQAEGSWVVANGANVIIPRGIYMVALGVGTNYAIIEMFNGSTWRRFAGAGSTTALSQYGCCIFSDGTNFRVASVGATTTTYYHKF